MFSNRYHNIWEGGGGGGGGGGAALKKDKKVFYTHTFSKYLLIEYNQYSAMVTD